MGDCEDHATGESESYEGECSGEWNVEVDPDNGCVVLALNHIGPEGVTDYITGMPPVAAINLAMALISHATCIFTKDD
jgi:hypothetical protein